VANPGTQEQATAVVDTYEPGLDGLRAIAVAGVVAYHAGIANGIPWLEDHLAGGFLGVSAFFTLSGFLITTVLLREHRSTGSVDLPRFYARRIRRLMPASLLTLLLVLLLTPVLGQQSQLLSLPAEALAALANVANWRFIIAGNEYAATFAATPSPLQHMWSLSVEEQWYLVIPLAAWAALRLSHGRRWPLGVLLGGLTALSLTLLWLLGGGEYTNRVYLGTDTRMAELAIGGLAAVLLLDHHHVISRRVRVAMVLGAPMLMGLGLGVWSATALTDSWLYRWGLTAHALATVAIIWAAMQRDTPLRNVLSVRPLVWLGRISYGVYLIHWPLMWWLTPDRLGVNPWVAALVQVMATLMLAAASYRLIEQPIRRGTMVVAWRRWALPAAGVAAVCLLALGLPEPDRAEISALDEVRDLVIPTTVPQTAPQPQPTETRPGGAPGATTTTAPPPPPVARVMVAGDSFAMSVVPGLQRWGEQTGRAAVLNRTIVGCGFGRGGWNRGISLEREWPPECQLRDATITAALDEFDPEVVVVAGGMWDVTDRRLPRDNRWRTIGDSTYDAYLTNELLVFVDLLSSRGATVVWLNAPHWNPEYFRNMYMGPPPYEEAEPERTDRFNALLASTLGQRPAVIQLDLAAWMRALPGGEFGAGVRMDGVHLTSQTSDQTADWMAAQVVRAAELSRSATDPSVAEVATGAPSGESGAG